MPLGCGSCAGVPHLPGRPARRNVGWRDHPRVARRGSNSRRLMTSGVTRPACHLRRPSADRSTCCARSWRRPPGRLVLCSALLPDTNRADGSWQAGRGSCDNRVRRRALLTQSTTADNECEEVHCGPAAATCPMPGANYGRLPSRTFSGPPLAVVIRSSSMVSSTENQGSLTPWKNRNCRHARRTCSGSSSSEWL